MEKLSVRKANDNTQELFLGKKRIAIYHLEDNQLQIFKLGILKTHGIDLDAPISTSEISNVYRTVLQE